MDGCHTFTHSLALDKRFRYAQLQSGDPVADKAAGADHDAIVDELVYRLGLGLNAWRQSNLAVSESETITVDALRCK